MPGRLDGKVVLISGTGGGQGRAAAELFASEGANIVGCDLNAEENDRTVALVNGAGGSMEGMAPVDLGDSIQARQWVADAVSSCGRVDVLYNNASAARFQFIPDMSDDDWRFTIRNELDLVFFVTSAAWRHLMKSGGSILNTSSVQALVGTPMNGGLAHAATKAGVAAMTRQMAAEGGPHGIRANSISPGPIASPGTAELFANEQFLQGLLSTLVIQRPGQPADVAALALFLASDESSFITGADFVIDGGMSAI
jgi:NAD(P)-dependent dehydrogenase (short-subunit alcohol dehydrogenase family)